MKLKTHNLMALNYLRIIKQRYPTVKIVIVYHELDSELAIVALRAGAEDILIASANRQNLIVV
ncbi:hypothetical protein [Photobacterium kishitanii]|uniref:hypothetical protein n=1 Tax=Photobacterium kishitanii TaxID=318456 RepID=UPI0027382F2C|nr:hypothetical protein [Photobacterium kishitanii]